jgi:hypothetical protein
MWDDPSYERWKTFAEILNIKPTYTSYSGGTRVKAFQSSTILSYLFQVPLEFDIARSHNSFNTIGNDPIIQIMIGEQPGGSFYTESPKVGFCELGHTSNDSSITENEKKLLFNIITHLYFMENPKIQK